MVASELWILEREEYVSLGSRVDVFRLVQTDD